MGSTLAFAECLAAVVEGLAELLDRLWPDAVQLEQVGLALGAELFEPAQPGLEQGAARRVGQVGREVDPIVPLIVVAAHSHSLPQLSRATAGAAMSPRSAGGLLRTSTGLQPRGNRKYRRLHLV